MYPAASTCIIPLILHIGSTLAVGVLHGKFTLFTGVARCASES